MNAANVPGCDITLKPVTLKPPLLKVANKKPKTRIPVMFSR
jgi:hypothetical protein